MAGPAMALKDKKISCVIPEGEQIKFFQSGIGLVAGFDIVSNPRRLYFDLFI